ncbi:MAG: SDR family oxidoreductase [Bacteroidales bacterium]|jgi:short-subunit dehydrogenase|nr:SDR family oxidoreductase [Bacteroidales bacterium]
MKTALITGASSGIGRELALVFAEKNYRPVLVARRKSMLELVAEDIKTNFDIEPIVIALDLSKPDSAEKLMAQIKKENLYIDVLVNNAGFGDNGVFHEGDIGKIESMMNLNMLTLTKLCRFIAPQMAENGFGHILNIASTAALQPIPYFAAYAATKAYVLQFSEAIAYELKHLGVYVTAVCPGPTQSEFQERAGMSDSTKLFDKAPLSFMVAEFAFEAMMKRKTIAIYGSNNRFLAFMQRFAPRKLIISVAAKMMKN